MTQAIRRTFLPAAIAMALAGAASNAALAASAQEIDIKVDDALKRFEEEVGGGRSFLNKAEGLLVFPSVVKAGWVVGGEYGVRIRK